MERSGRILAEKNAPLSTRVTAIVAVEAVDRFAIPLEMNEILVLGLGFVGEYISQLASLDSISWKATTTTGRLNTIKFVLESSPVDVLPLSKTIVITFPINNPELLTTFLDKYSSLHSVQSASLNVILFGTTSAFANPGFNDRNSSITPSPRTPAEDAILKLAIANGVKLNTSVIHLAGLYDNKIRKPLDWVKRIDSKNKLAEKSTLHLIHGWDIARVILRIHGLWTSSTSEANTFESGQRWILTDLRVYDWWELALKCKSPLDLWVLELMREGNVRVLPRSGLNEISKVLDSRELWDKLQIVPEMHL
ncbi:hypothetical protein HK098_001243 [Nowakowskiella sp. JEL0407]|nr:hypothetical protein HK098_001243 [Nowakowskiella sp. JEL0407]